MTHAHAPKTLTLPAFLTKGQIAEVGAVYEAHGMEAVTKIRTLVIVPNLGTINAKLSQENDPCCLAYAVVHALSQLDEERWS